MCHEKRLPTYSLQVLKKTVFSETVRDQASGEHLDRCRRRDPSGLRRRRKAAAGRPLVASGTNIIKHF